MFLRISHASLARLFCLLLSLMLCAEFAVAAAAAETADKKFMRHFVLDSGTLLGQPSPRSMVSYYRNWETIGIGAYDVLERYVYRTTGDVDDASWWVRGRRGLQLLFMPWIFGGEEPYSPPTYLATAGLEAVHEYAHRTRDAMTTGTDSGFNPDFQILGDNPYSISLYLVGTNLETGSKIWENTEREDLFTPRYAFTAADSLIIAAAGINQQVNLARDHAKRSSWDGYVDVANFYIYYVNASSYFIYDDFLPDYIFGTKGETTGDRLSMINNWRRLGRDYDDGELARNQLLATFLSGTTWSYILGSVDYVVSGQRRAKVLRYRGFRLPDFYNYYNTQGPTLKVSSDYKLAEDKLISFEFETVTDGVDSNEFTLGYDQGFSFQTDFAKHLRLSTEIGYNFNSKKVYGGLEIDVDVHRNLKLITGYRYYQFNTLSGQRDIPTLEHGFIDHEFFGKLAVYF